MNNNRRASIEEIRTRLESLDEIIGEIIADIEAARDEEQDAFDNMPESLQDSERGQASQSAIDYLEEALSVVNDWQPSDVSGSLEEAQNV